MPLNRTESEISIENEEQLAADYDHLKRQYKTMSNETRVAKKFMKMYIDDIYQNRYQRLEKDQAEVSTNLKLVQSTSVRKKDASNLNEIMSLQAAQRTFAEVNELEKEKVVLMDAKIKKLEREIEMQERKNGTAIRHQNMHVARLKKIRVYENRLNTATVQFNKLLTENTDLREKIEHFRKQRTVFNNLYKKLKTKSDTLKHQIDHVIIGATAAYNARDESYGKMISLRERNDQDFKLYVAEEKETNRIIDQEVKLQSFMDTKNSLKSEQAYLEIMKRQQAYSSLAERQQEAEMVKMEKVLSSVINVIGQEKGQNLLRILGEQEDDAEVKTKKLQDAFTPVCERYKKTEEQNFSLFQFVNDISQDVKNLQETITKLEQAEKTERTTCASTMADNVRNNNSLEVNLQNHTAQVQQLETKMQNSCNDFAYSKKKLGELFDFLGCDGGKLGRMLNNRAHEVTEGNFGVYLSTLENTINSIIEAEAIDRAMEEENALNGENGEKVGKNKTQIASDAMKNRKKSCAAPSNRKKSCYQGGAEESGAGPTKKSGTPVSGENDKPATTFEIVENLYGDLGDGVLDLGMLRDRARRVNSEKQTRAKTPKTPTRKGIL